MAVTPNSGEMLTVMILDVDLANRVVHVKDKTGSTYQATFRASGSFLQIPVVNEYWTVTRIGFQWFLGTKVEDRSDDPTTLNQGDVRIKTDGTIHLDPGPDGTVLINGEEIGAGGSGVPDGGTTGQVLTKLSDTNGDADWEDPTSGGVSSHHDLTDLTDGDDHPQYHNDARGDARYWQLSTDLATQAELDAHKSSNDHDSRYYTETEVDAALAGKQDTITTGSLPISTLDIDGGTDIGAALSDADLIIVDDGAGGTNRKSAMSRVWTYISGKLTGAVSSVLTSDLTTSRAVVSDGSGKISASSTTSTEVGYLSGVTGAIQTQIDGKQPLDSDLTTIAGLTATTDNFLQAKAGAWASRTVSQVVTDLVAGGLLTSSTAASTYAPIASPTFTGDPKAPTPALSDSDTSVATTAFVKGQKIHDLALPTAATPMNGQKFTGLAAGSANGDSVRYEQVVGVYLPLTGGTLSGSVDVNDGTRTTTISGTGVITKLNSDSGSRMYLGVDTLGFGDGTNPHDTLLYRSSANTFAVGTGDKIQQNTAPTSGDDLTNKTYVDSGDLIYAHRSFFGF